MTKDEQTFMGLGREVVRMIHELKATAGDDTGYVRRGFTFPGGEVQMFIVNDNALADLFDRAAKGGYDVADVIPPSQRN